MSKVNSILSTCHRSDRATAPLGCKQGWISKSKARQKDLVGEGVGQKRASPGTQKALIPGKLDPKTVQA